jgi:hypothetical protein
MSTHKFQEGLKNYRDLSYLVKNLEDWQKSIGVYRNMLDTRTLAYAQRSPMVRDSLASANVEDLVNRKLEFDEQLNSIEQGNDSVALATDNEFAMWGEILALEQNPALRTNIPEAREAADKVRLLKGVLQWRLDAEFKVRLADIRRDLRSTGEALVATQRSRRRVDEAMRVEPINFQSFGQRVDDLSPRIDELTQLVEAAMGRQRADLQLQATEELQAQKQRLDSYTVQARFALAAIYDLSSITVGDATP